MSFPTLFQEFIYTRTYSRWIDELNRRETWTETVQRYTDYLQKHLGEKLSTKELNDINKAILNFEVMPSMRALWAAGVAADADNLALYNCSFIAIEELKNFAEILYILMNGTGAGFTVEKEFINKLPLVASEVQKGPLHNIIFEDSKVGWAEGFEKVLNCLWLGLPFECDYSKIRPRGARLKTMGGRASGPAPLKDLVRFVTNIAELNRGHQIQSIDAHDICCKIADIVVVGGVRRSACISLSDLDDRTMANAKKGEFWNSQPQRMLANNSAAYLRKPNIASFIEEWKHLYQSNSGERGIFNRMAAKKKAAENHRRDASQVQGTNPCLTGDTIVAVADGRNGISIKQLAAQGQMFQVYCAKSTNVSNQFGESKKFSHWKPEIKNATAFKSGTKEVIEVVLSDGSTFKCTPDHRLAIKDGRWIEAQYCEGEQLAKFYTYSNKNSNKNYRTINSMTDGHTRQYRMIWEFFNGNYDGSKFNVDHISEDTTNDEFSNLQLLSYEDHKEKSSNSKLGSKNPIFKMNAEYRKWINKKRNILANASRYNWDEFRTQNTLAAFEIDNPKPELEDKNIYMNDKIYVTEVIWTDELEDVYDLTVEDNHNFYIITNTDDKNYMNCSGVLVHNCGEILLRSAELCNLSEVVVKPEDTFDTLKQKVKIATLLGTCQATFTKFNYIDQKWINNCEEERLLGVSLTGLRDHAVLGNVNDEAKKWLADLKHVAIQTNRKAATKLGINRATAITCVKPSGCQKKETILLTDNGILTFEELGDIYGEQWQKHEIIVANKQNNKMSTKFYINGQAKTLKIKMQSGLELEATENHQYQKFSIDNNGLMWVQSNCLKIGDMLPYKVGGYDKSTNVDLIQISKPYCNVKKIIQPTEMTEKLAYLLGLYCGDGSNHTRGIRIAGNYDDINILEKARDIAEELFGIKGKIYTRTKGNNADLFLNSTYLLAWLRANDLLKQKTADIEVPSVIRQCSKEIIEQFFNGYFDADGCIHKNGTRTFVTISKKMAEQTVVCLRAIGRDASYREMPPTEKSWGTNMRYWIQEKKGRNGDYTKSVYREGFSQLDDADLNYLTPDYIMSIEESINDTFDIEVPDGNEYLANSYISHNTVSLLVDSAPGAHVRQTKTGFYIRRVRISATDPLF